MPSVARRCIALRKDGRTCRAWAVRDSAQALCASHKGQATQAPDTSGQPPGGSTEPHGDSTESSGFYEHAYHLQEIADLIYKAEGKNLKDEMGATRVAVRHVLEQLQQELEPAEFAQLIALIFKGTRTITGIMRAQRSLSKLDKDQIPPAINGALTDFWADREEEL